MNNDILKKILTYIVPVVALFVVYKLFLAKKPETAQGTTVPGQTVLGETVPGETVPGQTVVPDLTFDQKIEQALSKLSELDKSDCYNVASLIYEDLKGWNSHHMEYYDILNKFSNIKFYFFVVSAYPSYDKRMSLVERLKKNNFSKLNKWSRNRNYNGSKANKLINTIIFKVENFKL